MEKKEIKGNYAVRVIIYKDTPLSVLINFTDGIDTVEVMEVLPIGSDADISEIMDSDDLEECGKLTFRAVRNDLTEIPIVYNDIELSVFGFNNDGNLEVDEVKHSYGSVDILPVLSPSARQGIERQAQENLLRYGD